MNGFRQEGPTRTRAVAARDLEQGRQRRLEPEVVVDGDDVEAARLGARGEQRVVAGPLVGLQREPELAPVGHVSSEVGMLRRPIRSIRMIRRSSGSGQQTSESCSSQSPAGRLRCFAGRSGSTAWSA